MDEKSKKIVLAVVILIALVAAGFGASKMMGGDTMVVEKTVPMPPGHKSEKEMALEAQKTGAPAADKEEKDLGGG